MEIAAVIILGIIVIKIIMLFNDKEEKVIETEDTEFKVGQVWKYKTRSGEENSTFTIVKIEEYEDIGEVIHISVDGVIMKNEEGVFTEIKHLPLKLEAVQKSITTFVNQARKLPEFEDGYNEWKEAFHNQKAGVMNMEVNEAVDLVESILNNDEYK